MSQEIVTAIRAEHDNECAVCHYTTDGPCSIAILLAENERLRDALDEALRLLDHENMHAQTDRLAAVLRGDHHGR